MHAFLASLPLALLLSSTPAVRPDHRLPALGDQQLEDYRRLTIRMSAALEAASWSVAEQALRSRLELYSARAGDWYDLGCLQARQGRVEEALGSLERAAALGFSDSSWAAEDPDLQSLRSSPDFQRWLGGLGQRAPSEGGPLRFGPKELASTPGDIEAIEADWTRQWQRVFETLGPGEDAWEAERRRLTWVAQSWDRVAADAGEQGEREAAALRAIAALAEGGVGVHPQLAEEVLKRTERFLLECTDPGRRATARLHRLEARHLRDASAGRDAGDRQAVMAAAERYLQDLLLFAATTDGPETDEVLATLIGWADAEGRPEAGTELRRRLASRFESEEALAAFAESSGFGVGVLEHRERLPSFEIADLGGTTWRSDDLPGRATLLTFWATWCRPCREEIPTIRRAVENFGGRGLQALSISLDRDLDDGAVRAWADANGLSWPVAHVSDGVDGELPRKLGISSLPSAWLLDSQGRILEAGGALRGKGLEATLQRVFAEEAAAAE